GEEDLMIKKWGSNGVGIKNIRYLSSNGKDVIFWNWTHDIITPSAVYSTNIISKIIGLNVRNDNDCYTLKEFFMDCSGSTCKKDLSNLERMNYNEWHNDSEFTFQSIVQFCN